MKMMKEAGASAVEFALILPLLLILTFGIIEFGVLLFDKAVITNASREGARSGIVFVTDGEDQIPVSDDEIRAVVTHYANDLLINLGPSSEQDLVAEDIVIDPPETDRLSGDDLTVSVTYRYDFLLLPDLSSIFGGSFTGTLDINGTTIMRME